MVCKWMGGLALLSAIALANPAAAQCKGCKQGAELQPSMAAKPASASMASAKMAKGCAAAKGSAAAKKCQAKAKAPT